MHLEFILIDKHNNTGISAPKRTVKWVKLSCRLLWLRVWKAWTPPSAWIWPRKSSQIRWRWLYIWMQVRYSMRSLLIWFFSTQLLSTSDIPSNPEIYATTPDFTKQSEYAVLTLMFLAVKYDLDNAKLTSVLNDLGVSEEVVEELVSAYEKNHTSLRIKSLTTGLCMPHVTNIEWKYVCDVKSSQVDASTGALNFRIDLGKYKELTGERQTISEFICTAEELQSLINRLKEIERNCERFMYGKFSTNY